ncbi:MAG: hypothetical protein OXR68_00620 [Alphaproteobacteria bacterium]|nr:hypothetical protein [Alphaproteobacteria bacterium]MDD9919114.1 hypothetical protein [Alphaproteobacteria bacterium]
MCKVDKIVACFCTAICAFLLLPALAVGVEVGAVSNGNTPEIIKLRSELRALSGFLSGLDNSISERLEHLGKKREKHEYCASMTPPRMLVNGVCIEGNGLTRDTLLLTTTNCNNGAHPSCPSTHPIVLDRSTHVSNTCRRNWNNGMTERRFTFCSRGTSGGNTTAATPPPGNCSAGTQAERDFLSTYGRCPCGDELTNGVSYWNSKYYNEHYFAYGLCPAGDPPPAPCDFSNVEDIEVFEETGRCRCVGERPAALATWDSKFRTQYYEYNNVCYPSYTSSCTFEDQDDIDFYLAKGRCHCSGEVLNEPDVWLRNSYDKYYEENGQCPASQSDLTPEPACTFATQSDWDFYHVNGRCHCGSEGYSGATWQNAFYSDYYDLHGACAASIPACVVDQTTSDYYFSHGETCP